MNYLKYILLCIVFAGGELMAATTEQVPPASAKPIIPTAPSMNQPQAKLAGEQTATPKPNVSVPPSSVRDPNKPVPVARPVPVRKSGSRNQTLVQLGRQTLNVDYQEAELETVLNDWRDRTGVNMVIYWPALESAGINRDDPVTLRLEGISPERVLSRVLKQVSGGGRGAITYRIEADGVVEIDIASPWDAYEVRVYYIADLAQRPSYPMNYR